MPELSDLRGNHVITIPVPGQATAGTADEWVGALAPFDMKVTGVTWVPLAAITADGTDYFTLTLRNRGAAAGTALPAQRSYAATNSVAFTAEAMTLSGTAADLLLGAGDLLTVEKLVSGNGLAMPEGVVQVYAQAR